MKKFKQWLAENHVKLDPEHVFFDDELEFIKKKNDDSDESTIKVKRKPINFGDKSTVIKKNIPNP